MMFLNSLMLTGVAAAVVPLVLHLLSRSRYRSVDWGAMMFLRSVDARQRQSTRVNQFLLLLLRMAIVGLLAVALARPVVRGGWGGLAQGGRMTAVIVMDCSASMGYDENGHTRLELAKGAARQVLEALQPGDLVGLVLVGAGPSEDNLPPVGDLRAVADRIARLQPGPGPADLAAGLTEAALALASRPDVSGRDVYLVCDRQASGWRDADDAFLASWRQKWDAGGRDRPARLFVIPVGGADAQNVAVESVQLQNAPAIKGQPAEVEIRLRNYGPVRWAALPLMLRSGARTLLKTTVNLAPDSTSSVKATIQFDQPGSQLLTAEVASTGLTADDRLEAAVEVVEPVKVLVLSGDERPEAFRGESDFLRVALAPFQFATEQPGPDPTIVRVEPVENWPAVKLDDYQVVVLANVERLSPAQVKAVEEFVYGGGGLLVAPGNLSRVDDYNATLYRDGAGVLPAELHEPTGADWSEATALLGFEPDHPVFGFLRGQPDKIPPATVGRYFPADPRRPDARPLAEYATGDPFLIEGNSGRGRVLLMTTPLDADWATLPLHNFYLPFMQSVVRYLAGGAIRDHNLRPGTPIQLTLDDPPDGAAATLFPPEGPPVPLPVVRLGKQGEVRYPDTDRPGVYRIVFAGAGKDRTDHFVVRDPRQQGQESDLTQLTDDQWRALERGLSFDRLEPNEQPIAPALAGTRGARELWAVMLGIVFVLAVIEMVIARAVSREAV